MKSEPLMTHRRTQCRKQKRKRRDGIRPFLSRRFHGAHHTHTELQYKEEKDNGGQKNRPNRRL